MILTDQLIGQLKLILGNVQPGDGDDVLAFHLETAALSLSQEFASLTMRQEDLTIDTTTNSVTFPDDLMSIQSIYIGSQELQPVGFQDFHAMKVSGSLNNVIKIQEKAGQWTGEVFSNLATNNSKVTVIYKTFEPDVAAFPEYYKRLILLAAAADYYLFEDLANLEKESKLRARYREEVQRLHELQSHGQGVASRRRSQFENDWNRALRHFTVANDRDLG